MKRVLVCVPSLADGDGITNFFMNYYNNLHNNNISIDFVCISNDSFSKKNLQKLNENNENYYVIKGKNIFIKSIWLYFLLIKLLSQKKYDILHMNLVFLYALAGGLAAKKSKVKSIIHVHNPKDYDCSIKNSLKKIVEKNTLKLYTCRVACSELAGNSAFFSQNYFILKNKIDVKKYKFSSENRNFIRKKYNISEKNKVVGIVARMTEQKNPFYIINVANIIINKNKNYLFLWIGNGILEDVIKEKINALGIEKNFIFINQTDEVEKYYSAMDLFFLPSKYEGFGYVFLEAASSGMEVFASQNVPKDVFVSNRIHSISIESGSEKITAETLLNCNIYSNNNRIEENSKLRNIKFNIETNSEDLSNIYKKLLSITEE